MVISQGGEEETLETYLKTLYSQEAVKPVGAPVPYHLYWLVSRDQQQLYLLIPVPLRPE